MDLLPWSEEYYKLVVWASVECDKLNLYSNQYLNNGMSNYNIGLIAVYDSCLVIIQLVHMGQKANLHIN